jgi:D-glutamate cyclase
MKADGRLNALRDLVQRDVAGRGLGRDPERNLLNACPDDFAAACRSLAGTPGARVGVVTGFYIPHANPPCGETDGPLGALFLARALVPLGVEVVLASDPFCMRVLEVGVGTCGLRKAVPLVKLPSPAEAGTMTLAEYRRHFAERAGRLTHLIAVERVGPSHTEESVRAQPGAGEEAVAEFLATVPGGQHDRCHTMRGVDVSRAMSPAHRLFEKGGAPLSPGGAEPVTIGIGDGGNEIGMGKVPWEVVARNVRGGGVVACRVPADHLVVCGVSNWGAYALGVGVALARGVEPDPGLFDVEFERRLLEVLVEEGPLVDGFSGLSTPTVDGLRFEEYVEPLSKLRAVAGEG